MYRIITASGQRKWVWERGVAVKGDDGEVLYLEGFVHDITAQHEAEEQLAAAAREWRQTFDAMSDSVCVLDRDGHVLRCNAATAAITGLESERVAGASCHEVFHAHGAVVAGCPRERALRSGRAETSVIEQDGRWLRVSFDPLKDASDGSVIGGMHVVSDITELKKVEQQLVQSAAEQAAVTEGVIEAIARTVEVRDPYTAGHQRRVADLAEAIARKLGYDEERAAGLRVAATLHDVGKIVIPAEILVKPGRLSAMEFELIKGHAKAGYDILAAIAFPWPVADVALQHHERLDGSGYPQGLGDGEILEEARIVAVADVVEAMSSHRPYRPALGIDSALGEIEVNSGRLYDPAAGAACLALFKEGFRFE